MSRHSRAPLLHIARASVSAIVPAGASRVAVFATRGALVSGFYQRELQARGIDFCVPDEITQQQVDRCIQAVKAGQTEAAGQSLTQACQTLRQQGATALIMGCTELPVAARHADLAGLASVDSARALAQACVDFALARGWNRPACAL